MEFDVSEVIRDAGESAKSLQRPGIVNLLEAVGADRVERIVVAKLDRLTRNVRDLSDPDRSLREAWGRPRLGRRDARYFDGCRADGRQYAWRRRAMGTRGDRREDRNVSGTHAPRGPRL